MQARGGGRRSSRRRSYGTTRRIRWRPWRQLTWGGVTGWVAATWPARPVLSPPLVDPSHGRTSGWYATSMTLTVTLYAFKTWRIEATSFYGHPRFSLLLISFLRVIVSDVEMSSSSLRSGIHLFHIIILCSLDSYR